MIFVANVRKIFNNLKLRFIGEFDLQEFWLIVNY